MKSAAERPEDAFTADGIEQLLARAEREPAASAELDFLADLVAAAELAHLAPPARVRPTLLARQWLLAVAASALFVGALALWFVRREHGPLSRLAEHDAPRYVAAELRDPERPRDEAFPHAMERYAARDWAGAAEELAFLLEAQPAHGPARFYSAAAHEQLGELAVAESDYRRVAAEQTGLLAEHARWRLANLLLAREDVAGACAELEPLAAGAGAFAANARALLTRLAP